MDKTRGGTEEPEPAEVSGSQGARGEEELELATPSTWTAAEDFNTFLDSEHQN